ncbi:MAG: hypothetical protein A3G24_08185 [Betaproteobacteria bacterium RIFCSPLOWO2_12_FULL_62_13]|nr:MAG: hypothetical protein A3G24_08185 [Betaproteobacteria bacterium RIFCSPLOWO2_12_FULL_62_13]
MPNTCIVVADGARARLFTVVTEDSPRRRLKLVEHQALVNPRARAHGESSVSQVKSERNTNRQAGPVHPIGAAREQHRLEHERRFGAEIVHCATALVSGWRGGRLILIAEPRLLGLMRERLRRALDSAIKLEQLAKDYSGLSTAELERLFAIQGLIQ